MNSSLMNATRAVLPRRKLPIGLQTLSEIRSGDVVLFKSSRDAGLRHLGDRVADLPDGSFSPGGSTDEAPRQAHDEV